MTLVYILLALLLVITLLNTFLAFQKKGGDLSFGLTEIKLAVGNLFQSLKDTERTLKDEFVTNRREIAESLKGVREELGTQLNSFTKTFSDQLTSLTKSNEERSEAIRKSIEDRLTLFQTAIENGNKLNRTELKENLDGFKKELNEALSAFKINIRDHFADFNNQQTALNTAGSEKLADLKKTLETSLRNLQEGNEKKLEEMRTTVDEKLQKTLEARLTQSFELVSKNLESVQKGLGEMQQLATGVGDLKKVLSNVKSRGILGEIQLGAILEQILTPGQYQANVQTRKGSREMVEYAICLPGKDETGKPVYLPVDAKFPMEDYHALLTAYETGDLAAIETAKKGVVNIIKKCARDIHDKYIDPPGTTDFGIMFLPFEGLYAEVVRNTSLIESLQRDFRIIVTGPSTLAALLSSLRLGFNTLAIEKQSSEIRKTLQAVKTEFGTFEKVLVAAQQKIRGASGDIEKLVGTRTRMINSKLKKFEELPGIESKQILEADYDVESTDIDDISD